MNQHADDLRKLIKLESELKRKGKSANFGKKIQRKLEKLPSEEQGAVMRLINTQIRERRKKWEKTKKKN